MLRDDAPVGIRGVLTLVLRDAATGRVLEERVVVNLIVTTGLNVLASALNWAFVQNYNAGWGSPFSSTSGNLGDVFGAVGAGIATPTAADTGLGNEIGREILSTGTNTSNVLTYQFFFGTSVANGTISEVGVFANATNTLTALTTGLTQNQVYTSLAVSPLPASIPGSSTITLNYGGAQASGTTQQVVTVGTSSAGATSITVTSFAAAATFPIGTVVAYNTGTLIDHALVTPPVTKTANQTATLNLALTLQSG